MPNYVRAFRPGGTFFHTLVTQHRAPLFGEAGTPALLPVHLHLLMTLPEGDADFSVRIAHLKAGFTRDYLASGRTVRFIALSRRIGMRKGGVADTAGNRQ